MALTLVCSVFAVDSPRHETRLDADWHTAADDNDPKKYDGFEQPAFNDDAWRAVDVPHNWDDYGGSHRLVHGNRHGYAWYRRSFEVAATEKGRRVFLFFEGVGSYATVWVNGKPAGKHAGGRTTFTLDVTDLVNVGGQNLLAVRADHPAGITDLPWVCGGCSPAAGFSEGSQPMGIFRPVTLVTTNEVRVAPFGVHVWNDADATAKTAKINFRTELTNSSEVRELSVESRILDPAGKEVAVVRRGRDFPIGESRDDGAVVLYDVSLWSLESPSLYTLETVIRGRDRVLDRVLTPFGIRTVQWPATDAPLPAPFKLNGQPVFINGTCEYEHLLGASHAFGDEQIRARVAQIHATGFNAFRDAHQPHNLRYQEYWDRDGVLWWTQFAAQIWYDTPGFRANFKQLLREWVRERRNSPSLVLWGLANESKLPADFAQECVEIIRELDPTSPSQRLVTTCNAGKGTDWNVPQNWTGTYGGDPATYAEDLKKQRLVGEYGAWRSLGLHSEGGYIGDGVRSEDRADAIFATKIRLAESIRAEVPGHFHWLFATHDNPGRVIGSKGQQGCDGWPELERIGPANNKGLLTLWGEPTDAFYLYRASYVPAAKDPMVYIVSHTWPDRWTEPGKKSGILVYSNCEEVELFNDAGGRESLGVRKQGGPGAPFRWDDVDVRYDVLVAEGRVSGTVRARDAIALKNLPLAPHRSELVNDWAGNGESPITAPASGQNYLYRVNCGGPTYTDMNGNPWEADDGSGQNPAWMTHSWAEPYEEVPDRFGSLRVSGEIIQGSFDQALFQDYRYGREKLRYEFMVPLGDYRIELYFMEPWYGAGGGNCAGWRLFDVAVNDQTVLRNVDIWKEVGFARAMKKVVTAQAKDGKLVVSFPRVASYQAVISAIAISTSDPNAKIPEITTTRAREGDVVAAVPSRETTGAAVRPAEGRARNLPASAARVEGANLVWPVQLGLGGLHEFSVKFTNPGAQFATGELRVTAADGTLMGKHPLKLMPGVSGETGFGAEMNAGDYTVTVTILSGSPQIESLLVK